MGRRGIDSPTLAESYVTLLRHKHEYPHLYRGYPLFLKDLNRMLGGLGRDWYMVVASQTGMGKTSFLISLAYMLGLQPDLKYLFVALEENTMQVAERLFSHDTQISRTIFRDLKLKDEDWRLVESAKNVISCFGGIWAYGANDVSSIASLISEHKPQVLIIDYIQLMTRKEMKWRSTTEEMASISKWLKGLTLPKEGEALSNCIAVVAAAQLNDEGRVLWSRDIIRDSDVFLQIEKFEVAGQEDTRLREIKIKKSRHSGIGSIDVRFNGDISLLGDIDIKPKTERDVNKLYQEYLNAPINKE